MIREFLAVAARAALEWALASLLLANGAAFCLITTAAARLRLGSPCIACARVHRLLTCSSSAATGGEERDALRRLLCDAHLAAVAVASSAPPDGCDANGGVSETDDPNKVSGMETHRVVSIGSEICEQDQEDGNKPHAGDGSARSTSTDDGNGALVSLFELAPIVSRPRPREDDDSIDQQQAATMPAESSLTVHDGDESLTLGELVTAFRAQRRELHALRAELASERRSRAEAEEYQRQLEEQGELDREAARLAMQLVHESETEKYGLQRQLDACRVRAQLYQQSDSAATEDAGGEGGGDCREANGGGDDGNGNNYQSLVDFLPGSVYSSSPDLANLLKLYTESGNAGRRRREDYDVPAIAVVQEAEDEEEVAVSDSVTVMAGTESSRSVDATSAIVSESLQESSNTFHVETVTEAA